jgi:flagellar hook-associated protein 3 FlgL
VPAAQGGGNGFEEQKMQVDPNYVTNLVSSLNNVTASEQKLTSQLSSGVRITALSDDPVAVGKNVVLLNQIQRDDSFTTTADTVTGQLQVADSALSSVVSELTSAISLATSANNGTKSTSDIQSIATQLSGILSEVTSLANTSYQGQYIFAGGQTDTAPFTTTTSGSTSSTTYNGDDDINYIETPSGQKIQLNIAGDTIFTGSGTNSVFGALNALIADYSSGTVDVSQATTDTAALNTALNYVSQQRVVIDNSINQISSASDAITSEKTQLMTEQTNLLQADTADVATKLSTAEAQQTALESVITQLESVSNSLFSKL